MPIRTNRFGEGGKAETTIGMNGSKQLTQGHTVRSAVTVNQKATSTEGISTSISSRKVPIQNLSFSKTVSTYDKI